MLNIYTPDSWHSPAYVAGDKEGLIKLRDLIDKAISEDIAEGHGFDSDGEGFEIRIIQDSALMTRDAPYLHRVTYPKGNVHADAWNIISEVWQQMTRPHGKKRKIKARYLSPSFAFVENDIPYPITKVETVADEKGVLITINLLRKRLNGSDWQSFDSESLVEVMQIS